MELEDGLAEAHASLGFINVQYDWDWSGAQQELKRALELNPSYATAHSILARLLSAQGNFDEAERETERAQQLDPLATGIANNVGIVRYLARNYKGAEQQFIKNLEVNPASSLTKSYLAYTHVAQGKITEAAKTYEQLMKEDPDDGATLADLIRCYALLHRSREAEAAYKHLEEIASRTYVIPTSLAEASSAMGKLDLAFSYLNRAYDERAWYMIYLRVEPVWDSLRSDPRFTTLVQKMNF